jgi:hypothetical protein
MSTQATEVPTIILEKYHPIDVVDHDRGFFSGLLYFNPVPVVINGVLMHKCHLVETEQVCFKDEESAYEYYHSNFGSLISQFV